MNGADLHDPYEALLAHHLWATEAILRLCQRLSPEQFHQRFQIGPGSLHDALTHVISAQRRWADRIAGRTVRPTLERPAAWFTGEADARDRTAAELAALLAEATGDFRAVIEHARARGFHQPLALQLSSPTGQETLRLTLGGAILHALTHAHYHRAQCMNMLRQLDIPGLSDKLPDLDLCTWENAAGGAKAPRP